MTDYLSSIAIYFLLLFDKISVSFTRFHKSKGLTPHLLLLRVDNIGDFVLWSESASHYHKLYQKHKITFLTQDSVAPLAKKLPYWQEVWSINSKKFRRNPIYRYRLLRKIAKAGFDLTIHPTFSRHFTIGDSIVKASKAKVKIGSVGNCDLMSPRLKQISDNWYTELIPATEKPLMELQRHKEFLTGLSECAFDVSLPSLPPVTRLNKMLSIKKPYFIIFPGASWIGKQWPAEHFSQLLEQIHQLTGWLGVICGGLNDDFVSDQLLSLLSYAPLNLTGKTTLPELVEIIRASNLLISNDTSAIHIAAATSTKSICILGGGHFGRFLPYAVETQCDQAFLPLPIFHKMECFGCNWQCKYPRQNKGPVRCIERIKVEDVLNTIVQILEKDSSKRKIPAVLDRRNNDTANKG